MALWGGSLPARVRILTGAVVALGLAFALPPARPHVAAQEAAGACVDGYSYVSTTDKILAHDVLAKSAGKALAVGGTGKGFGRRAATIASHTRRSGRWRVSATFRPATDSGFTALAGTPGRRLWAVGYARDWTERSGLVATSVRRGRWRQVTSPEPRIGGIMLTDVDAYRADRAWAVGYRVGRPGRQGHRAMQWDGRRWKAADPRMRPGETGMLAAVSSSRRAGTWVAGSVTSGSRIAPYIARRVRGGWKRQKLPGLGDAALADIVMTSARRGVAVGYRNTGDGIRPLVLRWNGRTWRQASNPSFGSGTAFLTAVSAPAGGRLTVTGSAWDEAGRRFRAVIARWTDTGWSKSVLRSPSTHAVATATDGDPAADGWVVGRALAAGGIIAKVCTAPAPAGSVKRAVRAGRRAAAVGGRADMPPGADAEARPAAAGRVGASVRPGPLPPNLRVRDVAKAAGLPRWSSTWSAVVADFDKDGRDDIFLGRHGKLARLYMDRGARYRDAKLPFGRGDRHGCAASDVDGSGLPDLYCGFGAARGAGVKANELWLDPGGPKPRLDPRAGGALEPLGRGRTALFLDVDGGGRDLVLGQQPNRVDGLPSANRVFRLAGDADLRLLRDSGLRAGIGAIALDTADIDADGRSDLLLVYHDQRAARPRSGIILYRNVGGRFRDVTRAWQVRSIGERDAELTRIDADGRADLVQLSGGRLKVSLQRKGRFVVAYDRSVRDGVALATGDADGDGDRDIYVLRQKDSAGQRDLIFLNRGDGRSFDVIRAPRAHGGAADDVLAIDHDQNGMMDFLALNGRGERPGPVQLVAFFPRSR